MPSQTSDPVEDAERALILAAATAALQRTHHRHLKVRQVAAAAGVSSRAFYRHFARKTDLLLALVERDAEASMVRLEQTIGRLTDPVAKVEGWIDFCVRTALSGEGWGPARCFLDPELQRDAAHELARLRARGLRRLEATVADGVRLGRFRSADPARDVVAIHHVIRGYLGDVGAGVIDADADAAVAALQGFALQTLGVGLVDSASPPVDDDPPDDRQRHPGPHVV